MLKHPWQPWAWRCANAQRGCVPQMALDLRLAKNIPGSGAGPGSAFEQDAVTVGDAPLHSYTALAKLRLRIKDQSTLIEIAQHDLRCQIACDLSPQFSADNIWLRARTFATPPQRDTDWC